MRAVVLGNTIRGNFMAEGTTAGTSAGVAGCRECEQEVPPMTDYRDPNYRDPMRPDPRDPTMVPASQPWSSATWGWIAGIAIVVLVLAVMFSNSSSDRSATDTTTPPPTVGQRTTPPAPPAIPKSDAPTMDRPAPAPAPAPSTPEP